MGEDGDGGRGRVGEDDGEIRAVVLAWVLQRRWRSVKVVEEAVKVGWTLLVVMVEAEWRDSSRERGGRRWQMWREQRTWSCRE